MTQAPRILLLDIETTPTLAWTWGLWNQNLSIHQIAEHPRILCFAAKWYGERGSLFHSEFHDTREGMLRALWDLLDEADIVVGWNSKSFDLRWIEGEFMVEKMGRPAPYAQIDLMREVKRSGRFVSNKLDYISGRILDKHKVHHDGFSLWLECMEGDPVAWRKMERYNRRDVTLLQPLYKALLPWIKSPVNAALLVDDNNRRCPQPGCGSTRLQRRGYAFTGAMRYARYACQACGHWSRGMRAEGSTEQRGL